MLPKFSGGIISSQMLPDAARQCQTFSEENPPLQISPEPILTGDNYLQQVSTNFGKVYSIIILIKIREDSMLHVNHRVLIAPR